jgi:hypothetical protein
VHEKKLDNEISVIAKDIEAYLLNHPTAADTTMGVTQWWLARQRYEQSFDKVTKALDLLVGRGKLTAQTNSEGKVIYSYKDSEGSGKYKY